jgi:eukaryotic-like serine/threonine-protein kinase
MPLKAGARLGPYEVLSLIGAGGMGEVYRARDTRLDRMVALKVLAPQLSSDAEFRDRFTREAKAISALNHAHICGLHDIGREHDIDYLVLELLEGETLAARLARGPLPLTQVLRYGIEIADALDTAHRQGIVHRDLKPGNVMLTPTGTKLLDFGLAKLGTHPAMQALSMLATAPGTATAQGTIIGTLPYMAPEQVLGQPADARTDIFALGALLYEMATGRRAFEAMTQASLIAKILETDPPVVSSLARLAPPVLDHVVHTCLAKVPADRWQMAHDVRLQLEWIQPQGSPAQATPTAAPRKRIAAWIWGVTGAAAGALAVTALLALFPKSPASVHPMHFDLTVPPEMRIEIFNRATISPDGQRFVFEATVGGTQQLVVREMASPAFVVLAGTQDGWRPFWSPDGQSLAFFHPDGLKHVGLHGGAVRLLSDARMSLTNQGTWRGDVILFTAGDGRVYSVGVKGGTPRPLELLPNGRQRRFSSPCFLPDGRHFLLSEENDTGVYVASLDASGTKKLVNDASDAVYSAGHLFYSRENVLFARPFDADRLELSGAEVQLGNYLGNVSVSDNGMIVYRSATLSVSTMTWFDRAGRRLGVLGEPGQYNQLVLSPRGRHATVVRGDIQTDNWDLWHADLATGLFSRLTTAAGLDTDPSWSPDERALAFASARGGRYSAFVKDLVSGKEQPFGAFDEEVVVDQWTPDGRFVIVRTVGKAVYAVPVSGDRTPQMLVDTPYIEDEVHVSPGGRWVAFNANESGRWEVYVAQFPAFTSKRQISSAGGVQPQWRADGRELFYLALDGSMMSARVDTGTDFKATLPVRLFPTGMVPSPEEPQYGVTVDGQRFLGLERVAGRSSFTFLINWLKPQRALSSVRSR